MLNPLTTEYNGERNGGTGKLGLRKLREKRVVSASVLSHVGVGFFWVKISPWVSLYLPGALIRYL